MKVLKADSQNNTEKTANLKKAACLDKMEHHWEDKMETTEKNPKMIQWVSKMEQYGQAEPAVPPSNVKRKKIDGH